MCLFATLMGQIVMTFSSNFSNIVTFQLIENVPFYHALAATVIREQGYGTDALATLFFLFGLSSVLVGLLFFLLGKFELGRIVYFFPSHVLVGFIGGIGIFIIFTSISVTNNVDFSLTSAGIQNFIENIHLFGIVIVLEIVLRIVMMICNDKNGQPKFPLLAPVYFCLIVPFFYLAIYVLGIDIHVAEETGYFFPSPASNESTCESIPSSVDCAPLSSWDMIFDGHVLDIFKILDFQRISWAAVVKSLGTVISMASFSLIHCPINIPAFAVSADVDIDMNTELIAHGYSNILSGK